MRQRSEPARFGVVVYPGVEPIDIGGTVGVISMARRVLPAIECITIAARPGPLELAGGLTMVAAAGFASVRRATPSSSVADQAGSSRLPTRPCWHSCAACQSKALRPFAPAQ